MKLSCPSCHARYTLADARVAGKIVKVRCKRCERILIADGTLRPEEPPRPRAPARPSTQHDEAARTGERHEQSVLFSLSALQRAGIDALESRQASASDSSGLIDLRVMAAAMQAPSSAPPLTDAVAHLGPGGVFARELLGAPTGAPLPEAGSRSGARQWSIVAGGVGTLTLLTGLAASALLGSRDRSAFTEESTAASPVTSTVPLPTLASAPPPASDLPPPVASVTPVVAGVTAARARPTAPTRPGRRSPALAPSASARAPAAPPSEASTRCCPGETAVTCEMRRAVGSACAIAP